MARKQQVFKQRQSSKKKQSNCGIEAGSRVQSEAEKQSDRRAMQTDEKSQTYIFAYSAIEQKRHHITSPGKCLLYYVGIFPFVPLGLNFYSMLVHKWDSQTYKRLLFAAAIVMAVCMLTWIAIWINRIFYVYMIDENGMLYRLRISNFWYKIKGQMHLLSPMGTAGGRLFRMYYMLLGIKKVLENISDTVTYEELIAMGKLWRFDNISEVKIEKRRITFKATIINRTTVAGRDSGQQKTPAAKKVHISRVYENDRQLICFLQKEDYRKPEKMSEIVQEIMRTETPVKKAVRFTLVWSSLMAWAAVILLSGDFARTAGIHAGDYKKGVVTDSTGQTREAYISVKDEEDYFYVSEYGRLYRSMTILYGSVELIYLISKGTDMVIDAVKKKEEV